MANYKQLRQIEPLLEGFREDTNQLIVAEGQTSTDRAERTAITPRAGDSVWVCRSYDGLEGVHYISEAVLTEHTKNNIPVVHFKRSDRISLRAVNKDEMGATKEEAARHYPYTKHGQI